MSKQAVSVHEDLYISTALIWCSTAQKEFCEEKKNLFPLKLNILPRTDQLLPLPIKTYLILTVPLLKDSFSESVQYNMHTISFLYSKAISSEFIKKKKQVDLNWPIYLCPLQKWLSAICLYLWGQLSGNCSGDGKLSDLFSWAPFLI